VKPVAYVEGDRHGITVEAPVHTHTLAAVAAALDASTWAVRGSTDGAHVAIQQPVPPGGRAQFGGGALRDFSAWHARQAADAAKASLRAAGYTVRGRVRR